MWSHLLAPPSTWPALVPIRPSPSNRLIEIEQVTGNSPRQTSLLRAGLFLLHDFLDEGHIESQAMEGDADADLWHAIMHRREPDYGNAKYWWRRVGGHPIFPELARRARPILAVAGITGFDSPTWDPLRFTDLCELVDQADSPANLAAREVQWMEMTLHLTYCQQGR